MFLPHVHRPRLLLLHPPEGVQGVNMHTAVAKFKSKHFPSQPPSPFICRRGLWASSCATLEVLLLKACVRSLLVCFYRSLDC